MWKRSHRKESRAVGAARTSFDAAAITATIIAAIVLISVFPAAGAASRPLGGPTQLRIARAADGTRAVFVTAADGGPIAVSSAPGRSGVEPENFLRQYGHLFGIAVPAAELVMIGAKRDGIDHVHTTYQQIHQGVRVFSGVVKVHQNAGGRIIAANGDFYAIGGDLDPVPRLGEPAARRVALTRVAMDEPAIVHEELVIVDPGWYGDSAVGAHLAYYLVVGDGTGLSEGFFVDANTGKILDRWQVTCTAIDRAIHDAAGGTELPGPLARAEGDGPVTDRDVNTAYDYAGDTLAYYLNAFGRDGIDDAGGTIVITVNSTAAPCPNAFWSFTLQQIGMCTDIISDDLVAHEITHGVIQHTANLFYQNQSGQLNESFCDVFGELVDLFNGGTAFVGTTGLPPPWAAHPTGPGTDEPNNPRSLCSNPPDYMDGMRWLFAEDSTAWNGAIRDMWNPPCMGDPDRANSPLQTCVLIDNGGVHTGSGIPNHAFAIVTDGKTFNGYAVNGIGPIKAGAVWYRALTVYLTVASDFQDAYAAFNQAAADLVGTYPIDPRTGLPSDSMFTLGDAAEVDKALMAVEMDTPGACGETVAVLNPDAPLQCSDRTAIFVDDFETGTNGWWVFNSGPTTPYDWVQTTGPLPASRSGVAWFCDDPNLGDCSTNGASETGVHSLVSPAIAMPPEVHLPVLAFTHYVETEPRWDGGQVLIRVNGGPWQTPPAPAFRYNAYNTTLFSASQGNTNPRASQLVFSGVDGQWGTSLVDLGTYVSSGDVLEVRFDLSKDKCYGITGWFVDDVTVYMCGASQDCNSNGIADEVDIAPGPHRDTVVSQPPNHSSGNPSDLDNGGLGVTAMADNFILLRPRAIEAINLSGGYYPDNLAPPDHFTVIFHEDDAGMPGAAIATRADVPSQRVNTGGTFLAFGGTEEWEYLLTLDEPVELEPGTYFVEILNDTTGSSDTFIWQRALVGHILGATGAFEAPGSNWLLDPLINMSFELLSPIVGNDCNTNSILDECDLPGDRTGDGLIDTQDLALFVNCLTGPDILAVPDCTCLLDTDSDGDLDLYDYATLQRGTP